MKVGKACTLIIMITAWSLKGGSAPNSKQTWLEAMGPAQGSLPAPLEGEVIWRSDFKAALKESKESGRPLLVTWRCLPCKQCASFDKSVLEGGPRLTPWLKQFITVRMTDAGQLDARYFPFQQYQDMDLSWWAYLLSPEGRLYGVYGGKDHISDATRISEASLATTLERVLQHHVDPRRANWGLDGPLPDASAAPNGPRQLPGFATYEKKHTHFREQACMHCHQVGDIMNQGAMMRGDFDKQRAANPWPLPENVGIVLDRDDGLRVVKVEPGRPAAKAGLQAGDQLQMANGKRLFSQADFRGVLHRIPASNPPVLLGWTRDQAPQFAKLTLSPGWRAAENGWRKTVYDGILGPGIGFFPLHGPGYGKGALSLKPFIGPKRRTNENPSWAAGLRPNMEIIAVNNQKDDLDSRRFLAWFKLNHQPGDPVRLEVRQGGTTKIIEYRLPK